MLSVSFYFENQQTSHAEKINNENKSNIGRILSVVALLRVVRLTDLLQEVELWRNMVSSLKALAVAFFALGATLYYMYMIYAVIGMRLFGGEININTIQELAETNDNIDTMWVYLNFNDFFSSINTLYGIMTLNGWELFM